MSSWRYYGYGCNCNDNWYRNIDFQWQYIEKHNQYGLHQINFVIKFNSECLNIQLSKGNGIYETPYSDEDNNPHTNDYFMIGGTASGSSSYTQIGNIYGYFIGY